MASLSSPAHRRRRTFFGLTVSADDASRTPLLMGQAVLATHTDSSGNRSRRTWFFCERRSDGFQLRLRTSFIERFRSAVGITRTDQPGLSIAIPFIRADISEEAWSVSSFGTTSFRCWSVGLSPQIGATDITAKSFASLAVAHGGPELRDGRLMDFIGTLRTQIDADAPQLKLGPEWTRGIAKAMSPDNWPNSASDMQRRTRPCSRARCSAASNPRSAAIAFRSVPARHGRRRLCSRCTRRDRASPRSAGVSFPARIGRIDCARSGRR